MSDFAIRAEGLGKKYLIGHRAARERTSTLRDELGRAAKRLARTAGEMLRGHPIVAGDETEEFWALRDISFEVGHGEVVGVIGRNGAGKSTLLKILSRITEPTTGRVELCGRVSSLLEVGTGFHPELSGRENIFLNGAILGMTRREMRRKFDEIVDFAGVEQFLDTPVKRYSSGMYVRLAFAVAAHLEPEILVVDEVLAVGDAEFQNKCLGKMQDVAAGGRTVIFVSHNLGAMRRLCRRGLLLDSGRLKVAAGLGEILDSYLSSTSETFVDHSSAESPERHHIKRIELLSPDTGKAVRPVTGDPLCVRIHYHSPMFVKEGAVSFKITTQHGECVFFSSTRPDCAFSMEFAEGGGYVDLVFETLPLSAGRYMIGAGLAIPNVEWLAWDERRAYFEVSPADIYCSGMPPVLERNGLAIPHRWREPERAPSSKERF